MQSNLVIGNIARINRIPDSNGKLYLTVADHEMVKKADGSGYEQKPNFVPLEGFVSEKLNLRVGQLVAVSFKISSYKKKDGSYATANDILRIDVNLNNISREKAEAQDAANTEVATPEVPAEENAPQA